jgi:hypothetical protein
VPLRERYLTSVNVAFIGLYTIGLTRRCVAIILSAGLVTALFPAQAAAYQTYSHGYSIGFGMYYNNISGIYAVRSDVQPTGVKGSGLGCQIPGAAGTAPVNQAQWIPLVSSYNDWVEIGTGHQCGTFHFWYWGVGWHDQWTYKGVIPNITLNSTAYMDVHRINALWYYRINGLAPCSTWVYQGSSCEDTKSWDAIGKYFQVGVESYDDHAFIPVHIYSQLQVTMSEGPWTSTVQNAASVTPGLCGAAISSTEYEAWQDASC